MYKDFINEIMNCFINNYKESSIIEKQFDISKIDIEETGAGFYINFNVEKTLKDENIEDCEINNVYIEINNQNPAAGCLIFVRDGYINLLEIYTYIGDWPDNINSYRIYYKYD
ncbi:MAG: hypothetical protein FWC53_02770 [Firmicutes bacterium]|nr:hypothetical protein [Bacillota bacterium]